MKYSSISTLLLTASALNNDGPSIAYLPGLFGSRLKGNGPYDSFQNVLCPYTSSTAYLGQTFSDAIWLSFWTSISLAANTKYTYCWQEVLKLTVARKNGLLDFSSYLKDFSVEVDSSPSTDRFSVDSVDALMSLYKVVEIVYSNPSVYFQNLSDKLGHASYDKSPNGDLFAFPFDWRLSPLDFDFTPIKIEIERRVQLHNKKVLLVTHSVGSQYALFFLNAYVNTVWKDSHIAGWISVAGALVGSGKALQSTIAAVDVIDQVLPGSSMRAFNDASPSVASMATTMANEFSDMLTIHLEGYKDIPPMDISARFFNQIFPKKMNRRAIADRVVEMDGSFLLKDPGVPVFCFSGKQKENKTVQTILIKRDPETGNVDFQNDAVIQETTEGDGTVPLWSQEHCRRWDSTVFAFRFDSAEHSGDHLELISDNKILYDFIEKMSKSYKSIANGIFYKPKNPEIAISDLTGSRPQGYYTSLSLLKDVSLDAFAFSYSKHRNKLFIPPACGSTRLPVTGTFIDCPSVFMSWSLNKDDKILNKEEIDTDKDFIRLLKEENEIEDYQQVEFDNIFGLKVKKPDVSNAKFISTEELIERSRKLRANKDILDISRPLTSLEVKQTRKLLGLSYLDELDHEEGEPHTHGPRQLLGYSVDINTPEENNGSNDFNLILSNLDFEMKESSAASFTRLTDVVLNIIKSVNPVHLFGDFGLEQMDTPLNEPVLNDPTRLQMGRLLKKTDLVPPVPLKPLHQLTRFPPSLSVEEVYGNCGVRCRHGLLGIRPSLNRNDAPLSGSEMSDERKDYHREIPYIDPLYVKNFLRF